MYNNFNRLYTIKTNKDEIYFFYTLTYEFILVHLSRKDKMILQQRKLNLRDTLFITK